MAAPLAREQDLQDRRKRARREVLLPGHVPVPVGGWTPRRASRGLHGHRHPLPLQEDEGLQRAAPDGMGRLRAPGGAVRGGDRHASRRDHEEERRPLPRADPLARLLLRLGPRGQHHRPEVLQVDAVDIRAALQEGARLRRRGAGQLVPRAGHGARERGGHRRQERARQSPRDPQADAPVDAEDHRVRRETAE